MPILLTRYGHGTQLTSSKSQSCHRESLCDGSGMRTEISFAGHFKCPAKAFDGIDIAAPQLLCLQIDSAVELIRIQADFGAFR